MSSHPAFSNQHQVIDGMEVIVLGMGCFWGAEKRMSSIYGVVDVECGYSNGEMLRTNYKSVLATEKSIKAGLSRIRNHAEVVKITFNPQMTSLETILAGFWESHNPTQGNRQGNDIGSNYRSGIYYLTEEQRVIAEKSLATYQQALTQNKYGTITTEIQPLRNYNRAEEEHQRYLEKHPNGYCGLGGIAVKYPLNEMASAD